MVSPELLRRYPYFAGIGHETLRKLAMLAEEKVFAAGTTLFREWDRADWFYVILGGEVHVQHRGPKGEAHTVDTLDDGDILVWSALVEPHRTTGVGITARETRVVALPATRLRELCQEDPRLGFNLMGEVVRLLATRLDSTRAQIAAM